MVPCAWSPSTGLEEPWGSVASHFRFREGPCPKTNLKVMEEDMQCQLLASLHVSTHLRTHVNTFDHCGKTCFLILCSNVVIAPWSFYSNRTKGSQESHCFSKTFEEGQRNSGDTGRKCRPSPRSLVEVSLAEKQEFRYNQHLPMTLVFPNHDPPVFWESHHRPHSQ